MCYVDTYRIIIDSTLINLTNSPTLSDIYTVFPTPSTKFPTPYQLMVEGIVDALSNHHKLIFERFIHTLFVADLFTRMNNGGMVTAA